MWRALPIILPVLLAGLWGAGLGAMHLRGDMWFLSRVEATMTDIRTVLRGQRPAPDLVTIVVIDDELVRNEGGYPLERATIARILDAIDRLGPKAVAIDLLLADRGTEAGDQALVATLSRSNAVLAAAAVFSGSKQRLEAGEHALSDIPKADRFVRPLQMFADVAATGVVNVATDQTGTPRFVPMVFTDGDRIEASFALRAVALAAGEDPKIEADGVSIGGRFVATDLGHALPVGFYGPHGTIRTISAAAVLNGRALADDISGRIVVIGATATGAGDVYPSPFDPVLPGVEVMSTAISHLASGDGLLRNRSVRLADAAIATLLPMLIVALLAWRAGAGALIAIVGVVLAWAVFNVVAFANGVWLSAALPLTAAGPPVLAFGAVQLWIDRRRARLFASQSTLLQHVQAPGLGQWLAENPDFLTEPVRQDAAIVFIDISGFTGLSERLGPSAVREVLNGFYRLVDEEAMASGGAITSFTGDGAMVLFGLPQSAPGDAFSAAACCVGLSHRTTAWLADQPASIRSRIGFKLGAHFGPVVASRLGGKNQQITTTGDTVNVASRLMEVAAGYGAELAVSDDLIEVAGPDCALHKEGVLTGRIEAQIRGRSGSLPIRLWRERTAQQG
jgi:adenylate cyclase